MEKTHQNELKFNLPEAVQKELDDFEKSAHQFLRNEISDIKFQKIRLQLGVYAQRQEGYQMQRVKVPCGQISPTQMIQFADVSDEYASGFLHLTTRQDIQLYSISIKNVPNMLRSLASAGITTREACGNTVRNITADYRSGTEIGEAFDVIPYALKMYEYLLYNKYNQVMGRKIKICFENSTVDRAGLLIHDMGFQARIKEVNGQIQRGFRTFIAGGLGGMPFLGQLFDEFIPENEIFRFAIAVLRVFDRYGERKARMRARMKFLAKTLGFNELKDLIQKEWDQLKGKDDEKYQKMLSEIHQYSENIKRPDVVSKHQGTLSNDRAYQQWKENSVFPHKLNGFHSILIRIPLGDIESGTARALADLVGHFSSQGFRVTLDQNLYIQSIAEDLIEDFYMGLKGIGLAHLGAGTILDTTTCPGADSCRLGITSAKGAGAAITQAFDGELSEFRDLAKEIRIKISGCPNSCAQHHVGQIGFHGSSFNKDNHAIPTHNVYVGGILNHEHSVIGEFVSKIPAKNVVSVVKVLLQTYQTSKENDESFDQCMRRIGKEKIQAILEPLSLKHIPSYEEDPSFYQDWSNAREEFSLLRGMKGECAGATVEDKIPSFKDAEESLAQARALVNHKEYASSISEFYKAMGLSAAAVNYQKLVDPFTTEQNIWEFENLFVRTGEASDEWFDISDQIELLKDQEPSPDLSQEFDQLAQKFLNECQKVAQK